MDRPELRYFGAAVIIWSGDVLLLQRKTAGYPVEAYIGRHTLIGGFWSTDEDASPRETIRREMAEEIAPESLARPAGGELEFFAAFDYRLPELDDERGAYWTRAYVFELELATPAPIREARLSEGEAVVVEDVRCFDGRLCWGHDWTLPSWADARGIGLGPVAGGTSVARIVARDEPSSYGEMDRSRLVHDPRDPSTEFSTFGDSADEE